MVSDGETVGLDQAFEPWSSNTFQTLLPWVSGKALVPNAPCLHPVFILVRRSLDLSDTSFLLWAPIQFLFPSGRIFLVPRAAICSPPGKRQPQDLPGKAGEGALSLSPLSSGLLSCWAYQP